LADGERIRKQHENKRKQYQTGKEGKSFLLRQFSRYQRSQTSPLHMTVKMTVGIVIDDTTGTAHGWSIPMAWAAQTGELTTVTWLLFITNLLWTIAYDTQYAMVDRNDDLKIGVKSTAILDLRVICTHFMLLPLDEIVTENADKDDSSNPLIVEECFEVIAPCPRQSILIHKQSCSHQQAKIVCRLLWKSRPMGSVTYRHTLYGLFWWHNKRRDALLNKLGVASCGRPLKRRTIRRSCSLSMIPATPRNRLRHSERFILEVAQGASMCCWHMVLGPI
jgi:hypothetical protein